MKIKRKNPYFISRRIFSKALKLILIWSKLIPKKQIYSMFAMHVSIKALDILFYCFQTALCNLITNTRKRRSFLKKTWVLLASGSLLPQKLKINMINEICFSSSGWRNLPAQPGGIVGGGGGVGGFVGTGVGLTPRGIKRSQKASLFKFSRRMNIC